MLLRKDLELAINALGVLQSAAMELIARGADEKNPDTIILGQLLNTSQGVTQLKDDFTRLTTEMEIEK